MVATRTPAPARLPVGQEPDGGRGKQVAKGLLAIVAILAIVVGVPVALYAGFGWPWPTSSPSKDWIYHDFSERDVLKVLVVVVWLAWLQFVACLIVEFVAELRGRGLSPRVPGGSIGTQTLARKLVGAVLLLTTSVSIAAPAAMAEPGSEPQRHTVASSVDAPLERGAAGKVTGPARFNITPEGETAAFEDIRHGVEHKYVEVQPPEGRHYDTMWGIAERYLGDGLRYREIVELNRGVTQPDGTKLDNPDLIYPGWILRLPLDAEGPGLTDAEPHAHLVDEPAKQHGGSHDDEQIAAHKSRAGARVAADDAGGASGGGGGVSVDGSVVAATGVTLGGGLLAAGLLYSLRRRRGWNGGPNPRGGKPLDLEFDLRGTADESSAVFVDRALRSLGSSLPSGATVPSSTVCLLGADGLAVTFPAESRARLASPWVGQSNGRTWLLRRAESSALAVDHAALSPWPGLVAIGVRDDGVETMLDVESIAGLVSIGGDHEAARDIAIGLGLSLSTNRWSDTPRVTFVGFADDLTGIAPQSIRHFDDLDPVFELIDAKRRRQHAACAAQGIESVRSGRVSMPEPRLWAPEFVVLSGVPSSEDVRRLTSLAEDPRTAVGVVVVGDVAGAAVRMVASPEGSLWCGPLGIDVTAHRMTAGAYRDVLSVFDAEHVHGGEDPGPDSPTGAGQLPVMEGVALDLTSRVPVEISTLGPVAVSAPGDVDEARIELLSEIVVYLAIHPEGIHPNVLAAAIWPRGVGDDVRDSALAQAATWLGADDDGEPRLRIDADGRWVLSRRGVRLDWDVFRVLVNRASSSDGAAANLGRALEYVQGPAWSGLPAHRYAWLAYETIEANEHVAVVAVARRLVQLRADSGDVSGAHDAIGAGLRMSPACEELWRDALRLTHAHGERPHVEAVATAMYAAISKYGSPRGAEPETDALVDELIPGYRRTSAA